MNHFLFHAQVIGLFLGGIAVAGFVLALLVREPFEDIDADGSAAEPAGDPH